PDWNNAPYSNIGNEQFSRKGTQKLAILTMETNEFQPSNCCGGRVHYSVAYYKRR
ncbi:Protein of unknown function, partial [Gryllus bimaculatus]